MKETHARAAVDALRVVHAGWRALTLCPSAMDKAGFAAFSRAYEQVREMHYVAGRSFDRHDIEDWLRRHSTVFWQSDLVSRHVRLVPAVYRIEFRHGAGMIAVHGRIYPEPGQEANIRATFVGDDEGEREFLFNHGDVAALTWYVERVNVPHLVEELRP